MTEKIELPDEIPEPPPGALVMRIKIEQIEERDDEDTTPIDDSA